MKLRSLEIGSFKNLRNFKIDFGQDMQNLTSVVLGWNGSGKSNLLEALIIIFRDLDLGELTRFNYILRYECRKREIRIDSDPERGKSRREQIKITVQEPDGTISSPRFSQFVNASERRYLPSYVFGYYSGPGNRMEKHFDRHQKRFYDDLLEGRENPSRPLLYARPEHSQFALLSFFTEAEEEMEEDETSMRDFLRDLLGVEKLVSVTFVLRQPPWRGKPGGDARFWNASGAAARLAAYIFGLAQAPLRLTKTITPEFGSKTQLEHLHLYLPNVEKLQELANHYQDQHGNYNPQEFFKALESTYISKILSEVRIQLQRNNADGSLTFRDMSEGEQQLLMVLGLLRFTKEDEALFLLDEPDTHLNPSWSIRYLDYMDQVVGGRRTSHVVMTTHSPLVVSALMSENVHIMQRRTSDGYIYAEQPRENPQGMGISGILTSELFGLRTALDVPTQELLDEQQELVVRDNLSSEELERLEELTEKLDDLGFTTAEDDPRYKEFLTRLYHHQNAVFQKPVVLTPEQRKEQDVLMDKIIDEMKAEGRWI